MIPFCLLKLQRELNQL